MKSVKIAFSNIQSHEHTQFSLEPGLNFILADDNNVGKSTIFKTLTTMIRAPQVSNEDLSELLRSGAREGYASFSYDDLTVVFWLTRDGDRVRCFFEVRHSDGTNNRSASCPAGLLQALDIVIGEDGQPINFNDADSVQLIVQDTSRNDAVFLKILVDERIENIRLNAYQLDKQLLTDYNIAENRVQDARRVLSTMSFNTAVDEFNDELDLLLAATRVTDCLQSSCVFPESATAPINMESLQQLSVIAEVLSALDGLQLETLAGAIELTNELPRLESAVNVLQAVAGIDTDALSSRVPAEAELVPLTQALRVLEILDKSATSARIARGKSAELDKCEYEVRSIQQQLREQCPVVCCPVKGEVFYTNDQCVPCST